MSPETVKSSAKKEKKTTVNGQKMERETKSTGETRPARPPRRTAAGNNSDETPKTATAVATAAEVKEEKARNAVPRAELSGEKLDIRSLKEKSIAELTGIAKALDVPNATSLRTQELIDLADLRHQVPALPR